MFADDLVVVDTNVISYILNQDDRARFYENHIRDKHLIISFQTLEELWYGAYSAGWGDRRMNELQEHLDRYEVIWPTPTLVGVSARLRSELKSKGYSLLQSDAWIASTAIMLGCLLATHDRDFAVIMNLELIQAPN